MFFDRLISPKKTG